MRALRCLETEGIYEDSLHILENKSWKTHIILEMNKRLFRSSSTSCAMYLDSYIIII